MDNALINNTTVKFQTGKLLTKEMLQALNTKIEYFFIKYENYSNGIISGLLLKEENNSIILGKGILKLDGKIYFLEHDINIQDIINEYEDISDGKICTLIFRKGITKQIAESVSNDTVDIKVLCNEKEKVEDTDIVIGIFEYTHGKNIKLFSNCSTPKEKLLNITGNKAGLNIVDFKFALDGEYTFHPIIFSLMGEILANKTKKSKFDYNLLSLIYANKVVSKKIVSLYIEMCGINCKECNNKELINSFIEAADTNIVESVNEEEKIEVSQKQKKKNSRFI